MKSIDMMLVFGVIVLAFFLGMAVSEKTSCDPIDANCDGELNLQDASIHMWRANQISE